MYRFLIYISYPYSIPIGYPLQHEIRKQGYEVYWFCDIDSTKNHLPDDVKIIENVEGVLAYNPHFILAATDVVPDFFPGIKVQIFHGFSTNKRSFKRDHFRIRGLFDLYTTHGPSTTSVFKELAKKHGHFEVIETGWSKVDPLFPLKPRKGNTKPVVMISSTFTTRLSLAKNQEAVKVIERLKNSGKYKFICVLHPKLDEQTKIHFQSFENENFTYFNTTELNPLFKEADIMLSDTTSAITEFQLLEKPVVTFRNNKPQSHFINITESKEIEKALDYALTYPKDIIEKIKLFNKETHPYSDGKSSKRVIEACMSFYHSDKSHLKCKPLNLVRKWQIRKKLKYFTLKSHSKVDIVT